MRMRTPFAHFYEYINRIDFANLLTVVSTSCILALAKGIVYPYGQNHVMETLPQSHFVTPKKVTNE